MRSQKTEESYLNEIPYARIFVVRKFFFWFDLEIIRENLEFLQGIPLKENEELQRILLQQEQILLTSQ